MFVIARSIELLPLFSRLSFLYIPFDTQYEKNQILLMRFHFPILLAALILVSCAGQRAPEGGPIDTDPPVVASTFPPNYTTRFSGNRLSIEFNKYVDHRSVEGAIFISPSLGQLEFDWSGREVEIRFQGKLRRSTTYVVTIGTDVADLHNRNKMAQSYTLAFTTGEDIDHGAIEGRVFPKKETDPPIGVMVFAYKIDGLNPDTLDPRNVRPDYVTQSGKNGNFLLQHLAFGTYRLIAVRDEYKNLLYDPEVDEYGVQAVDISLTPKDTLTSFVWMRLEKEDTTAVRLIKASASDRRHLAVEFSSPVDTGGLRTDWFHIVDTLTGKQVNVKSVCPVFPKLTSALITTDTQSILTGYRIDISQLRGTNGLVISPAAKSLSFTGAALLDSLGPRIASLSVADSAREVDLQPTFSLQLSDAVQRKDAAEAISMIDSSRNSVKVQVNWLSDSYAEISPVARLTDKAWYTLMIGMRRVRNLVGIGGRDSLRVFRFQTLDAESFSSIDGVVIESNASDNKGAVYISARNVSRKDPKEYTVRLEGPGPFTLNDILDGKYLIRAFRDRDGDKKFSPGSAFPFHPSERFTEFPDTLKVRARWPLEGVELHLH
jgi:hypothetical protein